MLEIQNADKYFHKGRKNQIHVIDQTTLSLEEYGLVALLGPSGCGKTTLLNVIGGLDKIQKGSIYVNGEKISTRRVGCVDRIRALNVGYIFQDYKLIDHLSVFENVALVLRMLGVKDKKEIQEKVEYVLECVGMLRYQKRPAGMLSGGERQRVGIARALVKDPNIILADEPTGNLDSKNTLEIMKIIKAISKKRLVILVTHEQELAKYYATRIVEIEDGKVIRDVSNDQEHDFDFELDNCFYLKDYKKKDTYLKNEEGIDLSIYRNEKEDISLDIVVRNGNIYIQSKNAKRIEVVDEESSMEFIEDSYEIVKKETLDVHDFDFDKIRGQDKKKQYTSMIHFSKMLIGGFQKVFSFPILKKILLIGFFLAGIFIMYSVSSIAASLTIEEKNFVKVNRNYLIVEGNGVTVEDYFTYEAREDVLYLLPGNSIITLNVPYQDYYQTDRASGRLTVSLARLDLISEEMLTMGRMSLKENEVIVDEMAIQNMLDQNDNFQMAGIFEVRDMLNRTLTTETGEEYIIVGIVAQGSPSIYVPTNQIITMLATSGKSNGEISAYSDFVMENEISSSNVVQVSLYQEKVELKKGRMPDGDYEVIVNENFENEMPLGKEIDVKVNEKKLVVVGYYTSKYGISHYLVSDNTMKYQLISKNDAFIIYPKDKEAVMDFFQDKKLNVYDTYERNKEIYIDTKKEEMRVTILVSGIILVISFIEIFLMIRSSFLSRIKEIGIYRAIGVKKIDIYKMFGGEIFAITTIAGIPGLIFMAYILSILSGISYLSYYIKIDVVIVCFSVVLVYFFNFIVGLIPVYHTLRKRPAEILSRYDLD